MKNVRRLLLGMAMALAVLNASVASAATTAGKVTFVGTVFEESLMEHTAHASGCALTARAIPTQRSRIDGSSSGPVAWRASMHTMV